MKERMLYKSLVIGVVILFLSLGVQPTIADIINPIKPISNGNTLYVGGTGPGNYSKIQDAIENASDGDTIFVYNGEYDGFIAKKTLNIIGENRDETKIISNPLKQRIRLMADYINFSNFKVISTYTSIYPGLQLEGNNVTVSNCDIVGGKYGQIGIEVGGSYSHGDYYRSNIRIINCDIRNFEYRGITLQSSYICYIENCRIYDNDYRGIETCSSTYHDSGYYYIYNCEIFNNYIGIDLGKRMNFISNCSIYDNYCGIYNYHIQDWNRDQITSNYFSNNNYGIFIDPYAGYITKWSKILGNVFENNNISIYFKSGSLYNDIYHNNFVDSSQYHAGNYGNNNWDNGTEGNFWDDYTGIDDDGDGIGDTPYDIPIGKGEDNYPLMNPFSMVNNKPDIPNIFGPTEGYQWVKYNFSALSNDSNYDFVLYKFDWGDETSNKWIGPFSNWLAGKTSHLWKTNGIFNIKAKAMDIKGKASNWSDTLSVDILSNSYPTEPEVLGLSEGIAGHPINFSVKSIDGDNDKIRYLFDGGEEYFIWSDYHDSGETVNISYRWGETWYDIEDQRTFTFKIRAQDIHGAFGPWYIQDIIIYNNQPEKPILTGPSSGGRHKEILFKFSGWDRDNHRIQFIYEIYHWSDLEHYQLSGGTIAYNCNETCNFTYRFHGLGRNILKVRCEDVYGAIGPWSEFEINIPRTRTSTNQWYEWLLERFPILERLLYLLR